MAFLESLDSFGGKLLDSAGDIFGSVADRYVTSQSSPSQSPTQTPEKVPDAVVQPPQNGPEQVLLAQQAAGASIGQIQEYLPWIAVVLGVVAFMAVRGAR